MGTGGFKFFCPECNTVLYEDKRTVCARCQTENLKLRKLFLRVMLARPHLQKLTMDQVFEKMYDRLVELEGKRGVGKRRK